MIKLLIAPKLPQPLFKFYAFCFLSEQIKVCWVELL